MYKSSLIVYTGPVKGAKKGWKYTWMNREGHSEWECFVERSFFQVNRRSG